MDESQRNIAFSLANSSSVIVDDSRQDERGKESQRSVVAPPGNSSPVNVNDSRQDELSNKRAVKNSGIKLHFLSCWQKLKNVTLPIVMVVTFQNQQCRPFGWLNVRHFQIILISLALSLVTMISNVRLLIALMNQPDEFYGNISDWDKCAQMWAQTIFFWGEIPLSFAIFYFKSFFDVKWTISGIMFSVCLLTYCIPPLVKFGGLWAFLAVRFTIGILTGGLFVQFHIFLNRWNVRREKLMGYSMALSGTHLGHSMMTILAPALYDTNHNWSLNFRLIAYWGWLLMVIWTLWGYMSPDQCHYLSVRERRYMDEQRETYDDAPFKLKTIPWKMIFTNMPFISLLLAEMSYRFAFWIIVAQVPMFFASGFGYPLWKAGVLSAIPHVIVWISCYPVGYTLQLFIRAKMITVTTARKSCSVAALIVGGGAFLLLGAAQTLLGAVTNYTVAVSLGMYHLVGGAVNHLDLAPRYSAVLFGITRGLAAFCGILAPLTAVQIPDVGIHRSDWNTMFYVTGAISIFGGVMHLIFGTSEVQDFNFYPP